MAHIEIFILNYNGARFLDGCLKSLSAMDRGAHSVDVSVVDNNSTEASQPTVSRYPWAHFIQLDSNYGFSKGNNLGVRARLEVLKSENKSADYLCFLNNDTEVEKGWLVSAIKRFSTDPQIGIVGSHARFYDLFVEITVECRFVYPDKAHNVRYDGIFMESLASASNVHSDPNRSKWINWHARHECGGRWSKESSRALIAVADPSRPVDLSLRFDNRHRDSAVHLSITAGKHSYEAVVEARSFYSLQVTVAPAEFCVATQNAGSFVTSSWEGGDIGMCEVDDGRFHQSREVAAVCGVSLFIKQDVFSRLGGFDDDYFAYFEDTDLSLRARISGYRCWYESQSRLHHVHCGTGGEFSPYFNFNVTYSHLLFCSRWMSSVPFIKKLFHVIRCAWRELKIFEVDHDMETKPNLKTAVRFLKHPLRIPRNRVFHLLHKRKIARLMFSGPNQTTLGPPSGIEPMPNMEEDADRPVQAVM